MLIYEDFRNEIRKLRKNGGKLMMKRTHTAIGLAATLPIISNNPVGLLGILGATAPDVDYYFGVKHRTTTHSLAALLVSSLPLLLINKWIALVWFISYGLHLVADSFTVMGVPYFYPWNKKYYGAKSIKTRGAEDWFIQMLAIMFIVYVYVLK